jgi:hypothetical protein
MIRLTAVGYLLFFVPNLILAAAHRIAVWAIFLFRSARAPLRNRLFLDFNLIANSAHFAAMLVMSTVPVAACWLPVRRRSSA